MLNRTIKVDVLIDEMTLEADTKLVEEALESMKFHQSAKGVDSPPVMRNEEQTAQIEDSEKLTSAVSTLYRSLVMKLAYVTRDRIDIAEAVKCLTRHMKELRSGHMQELKRLGRYLVNNRRCMLTYARQTSEATLQVHVESDWAGDLLGRKSTTGVIVRRGKHLLRRMSCLQTLVALSSGEAEYCALFRGACTILGIQSHYQDWMIDVPIQIYSDSAGARSVARRRGIGGGLRHMQTRHLWLQSPSSSWSLEVRCRRRRAESSRHAHETIARSQDSRVVRSCWSKMVATIMMTATANLRSIARLRTSKW